MQKIQNGLEVKERGVNNWRHFRIFMVNLILLLPFINNGFGQTQNKKTLEICPGDTIYLRIDTLQRTNGVADSYSWFRNDSMIYLGDLKTIAVGDTGNYYVEANSLYGCNSDPSNIIQIRWKPFSANNDEYYTNPNQAIELPVFVNDSMQCYPIDSVRFFLLDAPKFGLIYPTDSIGDFSYRPMTGFVGVDTFHYLMKDIRNGVVSTVARVLIHVGHTIEGHENEPVVIYPNPVKHFVYIKGTAEDIAEISVIDELGRVRLKKVIPVSQTTAVDMSGLESALYFIRIVYKDERRKPQYFKVLKAL